MRIHERKKKYPEGTISSRVRMGCGQSVAYRLDCNVERRHLSWRETKRDTILAPNLDVILLLFFFFVIFLSYELQTHRKLERENESKLERDNKSK